MNRVGCASILGLIGALVWSWGLIDAYELNLFIIVLIILPWAGLILASKWPAVGGILLIIDLPIGAATYQFSLLSMKPGSDGAIAAMSIPFFVLASTIFIYLAWDNERKHKKGTDISPSRASSQDDDSQIRLFIGLFKKQKYDKSMDSLPDSAPSKDDVDQQRNDESKADGHQNLNDT